MAGPDRQRAEQAALLKLQYEVVAAKLVSGGDLVTNELIALSEAIASTLPPRKVAPLEVVFRDGDSSRGSRTEEMRQEARIKELEQQLREARQHAVAPSAPVTAPSAPPAAHDNIVPISADSSWSALAAANSHLGNPNGVLFDASDPSGRRSGKL
jgi:hypothetical protein